MALAAHALTAPRFVVYADVVNEDRCTVRHVPVDCARTYRHAAVSAARRTRAEPLSDGCRVWDRQGSRWTYGDPDQPAPAIADDEIPF